MSTNLETTIGDCLRTVAPDIFPLNVDQSRQEHRAGSQEEKERRLEEHKQRKRKCNDLLAWPPDVFAVVATILNMSGAYRWIAENDPCELTEDLPRGDGKLSSAIGEHGIRTLLSAYNWLRCLPDDDSTMRLKPKPQDPTATSTGVQLTDPESTAYTISLENKERESFPNILGKVAEWWAEVVDENNESISLTKLNTTKTITKKGKDGTVREKTVYVYDKLVKALLGLLVVSDSTCYNVGTEVESESVKELVRTRLNAPTSELQEDYEQTAASFVERANTLLVKSGTVCKKINPTRARVLAKCRTGQVGLTLHSLTFNLSLVSNNELNVSWNNFHSPKSKREVHHNLLLIPWPFHISVDQFRPQKLPWSTNQSGLFEYTRQTITDIGEWFTEIMEQATFRNGEIHGVVFPELSLTPDEYDTISQIAVKKYKAYIVSGICGTVEEGGEEKEDASSEDPRRSTNHLLFGHEYSVASENGADFHRVTQTKHHRWKLDRAQITQYGLASRLDPNRQWWEYTSLKDRRINFMSIEDDLTIACLICEDLARPEPVAEIIRAVAPNLVLALLMDGPQLPTRWPARYATVLADDPGSSCLSLTSYAMVERSRDLERREPSRTVALWKHPGDAPVEIKLQPGHDAIVLTLTRDDRHKEISADARKPVKPGQLLALSHVDQIKTPEEYKHFWRHEAPPKEDGGGNPEGRNGTPKSTSPSGNTSRRTGKKKAAKKKAAQKPQKKKSAPKKAATRKTTRKRVVKKKSGSG